jgi:hypothetical protein
MNRRDFIIASGSAVLSGLVASGIQRPALGLNFQISAPDAEPSKVDSLVIEFETLEITPKYLDEKEPIIVQAKVEVGGQVEKSNKVQTSVANGETKNLKNNIDSLVVDGLESSSSIMGDVTVSLDHPDIQDSYSRQFNITGSGIPDSVIDHYETSLYEDQDSTLSNYYNGSIDSYQRQQSAVLEGSYSLEADNHSQNDYIYSSSESNLPRYPIKGDIFRCLIQTTNGSPEILWATPSSPSSDLELGYGVRLAPSYSEFAITKRNGGFTFLTQSSLNIKSAPYEAVIEWHDGSGSEPDNTIVVTLYEYDTTNQTRESEVDSLTATDSDLATNEGIAFNEGRTDNPTTQWDGYEVIGTV